MKRVTFLLLITVFSFTFLSCGSKEVTRQDLIGTYVANYAKDEVKSDSIEVKEDGTYFHKFESAKNEGDSFTNTGTWYFKYVDQYPAIFFINFNMGYAPNETLEQLKKTWGGFWSANVEDGGESLLISPDNGLYYEKQN